MALKLPPMQLAQSKAEPDRTWANWATSVFAAARDGAARAAIEEGETLARHLDPEGVEPILVADPVLGRVDVWFRVAGGRQVHAGCINRDGSWLCAALAPARLDPSTTVQ